MCEVVSTKERPICKVLGRGFVCIQNCSRFFRKVLHDYVLESGGGGDSKEGREERRESE